MNEDTNCTLTPALLSLLQACVEIGKVDDHSLAEYLHLSPQTIKTEWKRIYEALGEWDVHSRFEVVRLAVRKGWIEDQTQVER